MSNKTEQFIVTQVGLMLAILLALLLIGKMKLSYWYSLAFLSFISNIYLSKIRARPRIRNRILVLVVVTTLGQLIVIGFEAMSRLQ